MSKVFEALQRHLQDEKRKEANRDPLAEETGAPADEELNGEDPIANFELPSIIGAPVDPRSNEGMVISALNTSIEEPNSGATTYSLKKTASLSQKKNGKTPRLQPEGQDEPESGDLQDKQDITAPRQIPEEVMIEQITMTRLHPRLILMTDPEAAECEQYRTLRTELFHAAKDKQICVVTVTSALVGEGKTSTVLNLALAIAQSKEKRVLVIDGDLRRPNIASYLGLKPANGFAEILKGENNVFGSIFYLSEQELYVLPVNKESNSPTELLTSERLEGMLKTLREHFDFILIDSPPVMPFADSRLLANHSDQVIMVIRSGLAPYETIEKSINALPRGRILGIVLNGAEHLKEADYYDNYYSYARRQQRRRSIREKIANKVRKSWIGNKMRL